MPALPAFGDDFRSFFVLFSVRVDGPQDARGHASVSPFLPEIAMPDILTPITDICQNHLEASRRIADALFVGAGKLEHVALDTAHRATDEQFRFAQAVGRTRDMQGFSNLQSTFWAAKPVQFQKFQQECMRIVGEIQNEVSRATQAYAEHFSAGAMRPMPYPMPGSKAAGGGASANPFGGMVSAWESAMQGASRFSEQAMASARNAVQEFQSATGQRPRQHMRRDASGDARRGTDVASTFGINAEPVDIAASDEATLEVDEKSHSPRSQVAGREADAGGTQDQTPPMSDVPSGGGHESTKSTTGRRKQE